MVQAFTAAERFSCRDVAHDLVDNPTLIEAPQSQRELLLGKAAVGSVMRSMPD